MWHVCLGASVMVLLFASLLPILTTHDKRSGILSPLNILIIGVFVASTIIFLPIYAESFNADNAFVRCFKTIIISIHHTIRLFIVDSDFDVIKNLINENAGVFYDIYSCYAAVLFVLSPILTFGVVLSFFKNVSAYRKYIKSYNKNMYMFSELNEKSLVLAESIVSHYNNAKIVFADVKIRDDDFKFIKVKEIKAVCFKEDIVSLNLNFHSREREMNFFMISDDESKNTKQALNIIGKYKDRAKSKMYVFSNNSEGEALLSSVKTNLLKVRRISDVRTFVYSLLQKNGEALFKESAQLADDDERLISAVVVGLGKRGTEMVKALSWFGQMDGYKMRITAFDKNCNAKERFSALCPELIDEKYNNNFSDNGDAQYKIDIYDGIDSETSAFFHAVKNIPIITYVFVDLGSDEKNIETALKIRSFLQKFDCAPRIQAVVSSAERKLALDGITNHSGQSYNIDFVGDIETLYSVGNMIDSKLEEEALSRHIKWGKEVDFWRYEYNYRSSVASALHKRMKIACEIPGIEKAPSERTAEERLKLRKMEHRRWNAYMRSEGFTYAEKRNNLAKTHNCLVTYDDLTLEEKAKDDD